MSDDDSDLDDDFGDGVDHTPTSATAAADHSDATMVETPSVQDKVGVEEEEEAEEKKKEEEKKEEIVEDEDQEMEVEPSPSKPKRARKSPAKVTVSPTASTTTASTSSKRQPAKKEKDTTASPAASPQKVAAPLDPAVRARIASYQQKVDDLNQLCGRLAQSNASDDVVLQEIYGFGLDVDLNKANASELCELQGEWRSFVARLASATGAAPDLPASIKHFVARTIQSRSDALPQLIGRVSKLLSGDQSAQRADSASDVALEMEIKMIAQRTAYGARPAKANLYEDTTPEALWCWEVNNVELHFTDEALKEIKRERKQRKRSSGQLKALCRVLQLLHQTPTIDEVKVANEEAKISKFGSQVESESLKARDREKKEQEKHRKEQEKAHAAEEKKRIELEKQQAKEEERKRKEDEQEAERIQAEKRRKSLVSYFTAAATSNSVAAASADKKEALITAIVSVSSKKAETMAQMDHAVDFLVRDSSAVVASPSAGASSTLLKRKGSLVLGRTGPWSSRQHRDVQLGVMKLLQFHENHRPAYYGTFHKRSRVFRRGRRPFALHTRFDYTVDSEEEWEEEEPGESLSGADSDMDEDDDEDQLDYGDEWLAYEDEVEYVDGENQRDDDDVMMADDEDESSAGADAAESRKRRRRRVASENKKQKLTKLVPEVSGPFVCWDEGCESHLAPYGGELLEPTLDFVSPLIKRWQTREAAQELAKAATRSPSAEQPASTKSNTKTKADTTNAPANGTTTPHKPPVKRKIHAQLVTAASSSDTPAATTAPPTKTAPSSAKTAAKASAELKPTLSQTPPAAPRTSPMKSGITSWLKAPATSSSSSCTTASTTSTTSSSPSVPRAPPAPTPAPTVDSSESTQPSTTTPPVEI